MTAIIPAIPLGSLGSGESFQRISAVLNSRVVLERIADLSQEAYDDYLELQEALRATSSGEERQEILRAMIEIALDEPVEVIPAESIEKEMTSTIDGRAESSELERQANAFGRNLRRLRGAKGLNQADLARKAGMTQPQISYLEKGLHRPQETTVKKLADALGVSKDELLPFE